MSNGVKVAIVITLTIGLMIPTSHHLTADSLRGVVFAEALAGAFLSMLVCTKTEP